MISKRHSRLFVSDSFHERISSVFQIPSAIVDPSNKPVANCVFRTIFPTLVRFAYKLVDGFVNKASFEIVGRPPVKTFALARQPPLYSPPTSGPIEVRPANELPNKASFEVLVRPLANIFATDARATASTLAALEPSLLLAKDPRTLVQLVV
ncbi:hypothetical protein D9619_002247 [Psilocybe cf. subviscida]|uniref:Uncharacterized protein n=1 Tax=Psilocybe cf. subviscida TaxID=2480587 RepID=A0A8H5BF26_9AGAR|nr:hypothetical protein D9619_002247 [Psilocybe cf. subviscida]